MLQTFQCPNCQASLDMEPASQAITVRCPYCSSTVIVPESLRGGGAASGAAPSGGDDAVAEVLRLIAGGNKIAAIKVFREAYPMTLKEAKEAVEALERGEAVVWSRLGLSAEGLPVTQPARSGLSSRVIGCAVVAILLLIGLGVAIPLLGSWFALSATSDLIEEEGGQVDHIVEAIATAVIPATPEMAATILRFGAGDGVGPGFFNDTRRIGVDGEGRIYTGDYSGGRVQVFDAAGQFLTQWTLDQADYYMIAMAVDRAGTVYLLEGGEITPHDGLSGAAREGLTVPGRGDFRALAVAPDGSLVAVGAQRLVRFDPQRNVSLDLVDPFAAIADFRTTHDNLAVDGAGNIYIAGSETIYKLDRQGRFVDRIGSRGNGPDQFMTSPSAIAVDGKGRLYANDFDGIRVFEASGRYLGLIDLAGVSFGMVVNDQNQLVVMDRNSNEVLVFDLSTIP